MKKELDEQLCKDYPHMFKDRNKNMTETCMYWGFECGDGWYWLINNLCHSIQSHITQSRNSLSHSLKWNRKLQRAIDENKVVELANDIHKNYTEPYKTEAITKFVKHPEKHFYEIDKKNYPFKVVATQVKEKFGGLRFYYTGGTNEVDGMVDLAEHMSYSMCEFCGSTKNIKISIGWIITACQECVDTNENLKNRKWR